MLPVTSDCFWLRRHDRRVAGMLADPECVGDLLLVGVVLARWLDFTYRSSTDADGLSDAEIDQAVFGGDGQRVAQTVLNDVRRYDPTGDADQVTCCGSPFSAGPGGCRRPAVKKVRLSQAGGEQRWVGSCIEHAVAFNALVVEHGALAVPVTGAANAGGVLARHLPEFDWHEVYRSFDERWKPPREAAPDGRRRPVLRIVGRTFRPSID